MKQCYSIFLVLLFLISGAYAQDLPYIRVNPEEAEITVGDTIVFTAVYVDTKDGTENETDTLVAMSVYPDSLGSFLDDTTFVANMAGEGYLAAQLGELADTLEIEVEAEDDDEEDTDQPKIKIWAENRVFFTGDTTSFKVIYSDSLENETDTLVALTVTPDSLGYFLDDTTFVAENIGMGKVTAELDDLSDSIVIRIRKQRNFDMDHNLTILPEDTIINIGSALQYNAYYQYDEMLVDTTADSWNVRGMDIGTIDETGLFNSTGTGFGVINAYSENSIGTSFLIVEDSTTDDNINTITLTRDHPAPNKEYKIIKTLTEGDRWIIGGMPHPFNIYNGGMLYFPVGCISEDIRIHISLPKFADVEEDSVNFGNGKRKILSAINFDVYVNDTTLTEPYYFDSPLIAGLVFKRGLLRQYNIAPENLSLYYVDNDTANVDFDSTGIIQPVVDYYHNRIYSGIAHFSTLAIAGRSGGSVVKTEETRISLPEKFSLQQNYPNPFNPTTTLRFDLNEKADVRLDIYNVLGEKVETLVNGNFNRGTYKVQWNASEMPSGIYFIRMTAGQKTATIRSLLLK